MSAKKIIMLLLIAGVAATGAFASGDKEEESEAARPEWRHGPWGEAPELSEETITVTGQLYFENRMHPELESGSTEYELLVPRFYVGELDLEEGQTITVEGYTVEGMPCCDEEEEGEVHLLVTKAIIDGEEYELDARDFRDGPRWSMGPGRRPHGHHSGGFFRDWERKK